MPHRMADRVSVLGHCLLLQLRPSPTVTNPTSATISNCDSGSAGNYGAGGGSLRRSTRHRPTKQPECYTGNQSSSYPGKNSSSDTGTEPSHTFHNDVPATKPTSSCHTTPQKSNLTSNKCTSPDVTNLLHSTVKTPNAEITTLIKKDSVSSSIETEKGDSEKLDEPKRNLAIERDKIVGSESRNSNLQQPDIIIQSSRPISDIITCSDAIDINGSDVSKTETKQASLALDQPTPSDEPVKHFSKCSPTRRSSFFQAIHGSPTQPYLLHQGGSTTPTPTNGVNTPLDPTQLFQVRHAGFNYN